MLALVDKAFGTRPSAKHEKSLPPLTSGRVAVICYSGLRDIKNQFAGIDKLM